MSAPADWRALWEQADRLIGVGRPADAVTLLHDALRLAPDEGHLHCQLSWALMRMGRIEESLAAAGRAAGLRPHDEWAQRLRSIALGALDRRRESLEAARAARALAPAKPVVLEQLVHALMAAGGSKEAREVAGELLALAPDDADTHALLGRLAADAEEWKEAEAHYRKALEMDAGQHVYLVGLAAALRKQERRDEALEVLHAAARVAPGSPTVQRELEAFAGGHLDFKLQALMQAAMLGTATVFLLVVTVKDALKGLSVLLAVQALCVLGMGALTALWASGAARTLSPPVRRFYVDLWRSRLRRLVGRG